MDNGNNTIGLTAKVSFLSLGKSVTAKVDTGADLSSLDAHDVQMDGQFVRFRSPSLSNNILRIPVKDNVEVRNSDGQTEKRPVIECRIEIDGAWSGTGTFTLNDRGNNNYPVLIGANILKAGNFSISATEGEVPHEIKQVIDNPINGKDNVSKEKEPVEVKNPKVNTLDPNAKEEDKDEKRPVPKDIVASFVSLAKFLQKEYDLDVIKILESHKDNNKEDEDDNDSKESISHI